MSKYTVTSEPIVQTGEFGPYKLADLKGEAGETFSRVFFGGKSAVYKNVYLGGVVEGDIDASGRGPKFVVPRGNSWGNKGGKTRDYDAEEERRSKRIAYLASMERAVEVMTTMFDHADLMGWKAGAKPTKEQIRTSLVDWRDWFISEYEENTK